MFDFQALVHRGVLLICCGLQHQPNPFFNSSFDQLSYLDGRSSPPIPQKQHLLALFYMVHLWLNRVLGVRFRFLSNSNFRMVMIFVIITVIIISTTINSQSIDRQFQQNSNRAA